VKTPFLLNEPVVHGELKTPAAMTTTRTRFDGLLISSYIPTVAELGLFVRGGQN
jgi:hypothetical protein